MPVLFIVLEGIDGSGTSSNSRLLVDWLIERGTLVVMTKEPSDGDIGFTIRRYLKRDVHPAVDALLFAADRVEHFYEVIEPSLKAGSTVVSDRFMESSIAYQSAQGLAIDWILKINKFVSVPDLTIVLDVDPVIAFERIKHRALEKFERPRFLAKVREVLLARAEEKGYSVINASGSLSGVQREIRELVSSRMG